MVTDLNVYRSDGSPTRLGELISGPTLLVLLRHLA